MTRDSFDDIARRGFTLDDVCVGPDSLVAACIADGMVADRMDDPSFWELNDEARLEVMRNVFDVRKAAILRSQHKIAWGLNIERYLLS